jgi:hypothetical protein
MLYHEHYPVRGYQSTVDARVHLGLGENKKIDSLQVIWPDGETQRLYDVLSDQRLTLDYLKGKESIPSAAIRHAADWQDVTKLLSIDFVHKETPYTDFNIQPLLPHKFSMGGPGLAVGDVDGDGLTTSPDGSCISNPRVNSLHSRWIRVPNTRRTWARCFSMPTMITTSTSMW